MRKIIAICFCFIVCLAFTACKDKEAVQAPSGMQLASDTEIPDYTLFVPENWTVDISTGTTAAYLKDQWSNVLATFTASFSVPSSNEITLENYFDSYKTEFSDVFGEPADLVEEDITLNGVKAKQYIYSSTFGETEYKFWQVVCFRESRIYTLTYSSDTKNFDNYAEDMQLILDNFTFTK